MIQNMKKNTIILFSSYTYFVMIKLRNCNKSQRKFLCLFVLFSTSHSLEFFIIDYPPHHLLMCTLKCEYYRRIHRSFTTAASVKYKGSRSDLRWNSLHPSMGLVTVSMVIIQQIKHSNDLILYFASFWC